ncbi:MAG: hypothetical protein BWY69_00196 [Planctomycetes bacterium ADurb.Bin401]|nr:MAG: hypothetical protein BWY69_00196 [Planctomycetes bacterium ADurb.Bin401]
MKLLFTFIIVFCFIFQSCCPRVVLPPTRDTSSVTNIETKETWIDTLAKIQLPDETTTNITGDSTSTVETSVATSTVKIDKSGKVTHIISNKREPLFVPTKFLVKAVHQNKETTIKEREYIPIEKELTKWQKFLIYAGGVLVSAIGGAILFGIWKLIRRFII